MTTLAIVLTIVITIIGISMWVLTWLSISQKRKLAELALMGAKVTFKERENGTVWFDYVTTDNKSFKKLEEAYMHQIKLSKAKDRPKTQPKGDK